MNKIDEAIELARELVIDLDEVAEFSEDDFLVYLHGVIDALKYVSWNRG